MNIIFATGNKGKMREVREILGSFSDNILSMKEAGLNPEIIEDGSTYEENAMIKAKAVSAAAAQAGIKDVLVLADDSGLEVAAMDNGPGIYSARFMGEDTPYDIKNAEIIKRVNESGNPDRSARFVCTIAAVFPDGTQKTVRGTVEGEIADKEYGTNGFGFDPIFFVPSLGCTTAQLDPMEKHKLSHRGKALRAMKAEIEKHENIGNK